MAKTNKQGFFAVTNLPADTFQIYGLSTASDKLFFTPGSDSIAFLDHRVAPSAKFFPAKDTTFTDTDTLLVVGRTRFSPGPINLLEFGEDYFDLRLDKYLHPIRKYIDLIFTQSVADTFNIEPINFEPKEGWKYTEMSPKSDSIRIWLTDSMNYKMDTLIFKVTYVQQDSLKEYYAKNDTVRLFFTDVVQANKNKRKERHKIEKETKGVTILSNLKSGFDIFRKATLESPEPIESFDTTKISLFEKRDSVYKKITYKLTPDSLNKRKYLLAYPWKFATDYKLKIDSLALTTIYCDEIKTVFAGI